MLRLKKVYAILSSALLLTAVSVMAQESAPAAPAAEAPAAGAAVAEAPAPTPAPAPAQDPSGRGRNRILAIEGYGATLDSLFAYLNGHGVAAASPIYGRAKGQLRKAGSTINRKPRSKEADLEFTIASTAAETAIIELEREINLLKIRQMNAKRDSLLLALHTIHETINRIEGSRANKMSMDLEAAKAQSSMLQGDLEATQAQARMLKEDLAAERERARKEREEANKRFDALKSAQLSISRDARGTIITMADILFESGKANLTPALRENLATIAGILIAYKDPKILIEGHTDNRGSKEMNQKLSEDRAANVLNLLVERGVAADRLTSLGHAFEKPIADNNTAEGRAKNRRVDLIVQDGQIDNEEGAE